VYQHAKQAGFSLFELILVILLLGIMAGGAGMLINTPIDAYSDQVRRQLLVDQAEMALRQIARDVRRALPNSIRTTTDGTIWALEMVNTIDGARYRDEPGGIYNADTDILDFTKSDEEFNLLGLLNSATLASGQRLVIYNTAPDNIYSDAVSNANPGIITPAASTGFSLALSVNGIENHITMAPSPGFQFAQQSPGQRVFVVDGPISYICDPGSGLITRYSGYSYTVAQPTPPAGANEGPVVTRVIACSFNYTAGTAQRGGLITLEITLSDSGESVTLLHQVHVDNVP